MSNMETDTDQRSRKDLCDHLSVVCIAFNQGMQDVFGLKYETQCFKRNAEH